MGKKISDDLIFNELFGEYGSLLTDNQREVFYLYYSCDLSLAEISEMKGVSRQSVSDALAKTREALRGYDEKLDLINKKRNLQKLLGGVTNEDVKSALSEAIGKI